MGLDTSHDCWRGAYSAFTRWRNELARVAGYGVGKVEGTFLDLPQIDWGSITDDNLHGKWDATPSDPLMILIAHSDCDGEIHPKDAGPLADRMESLLPLLSGDGGGHIGLYREKTEKFIKGLRSAAAANEVIGFH